MTKYLYFVHDQNPYIFSYALSYLRFRDVNYDTTEDLQHAYIHYNLVNDSINLKDTKICTRQDELHVIRPFLSSNETFHQCYDLFTDIDLQPITRCFNGAFATGVACQQGTLTLLDT